MRTTLAALLVAIACILQLAPSASAAPPRQDVLVVLKESVGKPRVQADKRRVRVIARRLGVDPGRIFPAITPSFTASVTRDERRRLADDPRVRAVIDDAPVEHEWDLNDERSKIRGRPGRERIHRQITPKWLKRVGATRLDRKLGNGKGRKRPPFDADIAIIDTGISKDHPDVRPAGGKDCTRSGSWVDGWGHGVAIAGLLGARDNKRGIVGMLPGVRLWSVRIFDSKERSRLSNVLCALDWVASKRDRRRPDKPFFEGVTLSFSVSTAWHGVTDDGRCGRRWLDLIHQGVCRIVNQGTIVVAAAGNYGQRVKLRRPAGYREVITVSAMVDFDGKPGGKGRQSQACAPGSARERDDQFASFSSFGSAVDLIAPGKCIWVTFLKGTYARVAGTSFAAPIALAAALRYRKRYPNAKPNQVKQALVRAGRYDWKVGSDPDRAHEPRVDVRGFRPPPVFSYRKLERKTLRREGERRVFVLRTRHSNGHTASIRVRVAKKPRGVGVRLRGSRVYIVAKSAARTGMKTVVLKASDGDTKRTIKIPIRIRRHR